MVTKINGNRYETLVVTESHTTFVLDRKAVIYGGGEIVGVDAFAGYGIVEDIVDNPSMEGNTYRIDGRIVGLSSGIATFGDNAKIIIGKGAEVTATLGFGTAIPSSSSAGAVSTTGENSRITIGRGAEIEGVLGVLLAGSDSVVTNSGDITGSFVGMSAGNVLSNDMTPLEDIKLVNKGYVESLIGMIAAGVDGAVLDNGKKGEIVGFAIGMAAFSLDDTKTTIKNNGTVRVLLDGQGSAEDPLNSSAAVLGGEGDETVRNTGKLLGNVVLGAGDDTFDNTGGFVGGAIFGGAGADTLTVDKAGYTLVELENEGLDTIRSSVSYKLTDNVEYLLLIGNKNINATGNDSLNILLGNRGNNILTGGGEVDIFAFKTGGGKDTIADFGNGADVINLSRWKAIDDYAAVEANADDKNGDVWIKSGKDILIIADHAVDDLDPSQFSWDA